MNQKDIKLLWGRAANRCAICRVELTQDGKSHAASFVLGEQAHIVGEKEGAARGISSLSDEERNSYHNIILLCPTHHTEIDKNEGDWSIEKLHITKSKHELWVREALGEEVNSLAMAKQLGVVRVIDSAVKLCQLENWKIWTSHALAPDPSWSCEHANCLFEFRQVVAATIWPPEFDELNRATTTLAIVLHDAISTFRKHSRRDKERYWPVKFYKSNGYNPNYMKDVDKYEDWLDECYRLVRDSTRAANWFADVVRRDVNPLFFVERGKFLIIDGPYEDFSYKASVPEFEADMKDKLPNVLFDSGGMSEQKFL